jgi:hypothetical protein
MRLKLSPQARIDRKVVHPVRTSEAEVDLNLSSLSALRFSPLRLVLIDLDSLKSPTERMTVENVAARQRLGEACLPRWLRAKNEALGPKDDSK